MIWLAFGAMFLLAVAIIVRPLFGTHEVPVSAEGAEGAEGNEALDVYRQQLKELERDVALGLLKEEDAEAARLEIHRNILELSDRSREGDGFASKTIVAAVAALVLAGVSLAYWRLGHPELVSVPAKPSVSEAPQFQLPPEMGKIEDRLAGLAAKLEAESDNLEGWTMLARSYGVLGRTADAANAYARAVALDPDNIELRLVQAEQLVDALGGLVSPAAILVFRQAQEIDPGHPAPRFYIAVAEYQNGQIRKALGIWKSLEDDSPADAPWLPSLKAQIARAELDLGVGE